MTNAFSIATIAWRHMSAETPKAPSGATGHDTPPPRRHRQPPRWERRPRQGHTLTPILTHQRQSDTRSPPPTADTLHRRLPPHRQSPGTVNGTLDSVHATLVFSAAVRVLALISMNATQAIRAAGINDAWTRMVPTNASICWHAPVDSRPTTREPNASVQ